MDDRSMENRARVFFARVEGGMNEWGDNFQNSFQKQRLCAVIATSNFHRKFERDESYFE